MDTISIPLEIRLEATPGKIKLIAQFVSAVITELSARPMTPKERSEHAHFGGKKPPTEFGLLVDTKEVCKLLKISARTIWAMHTQGRMPAPIRICSAVRWPYSQLHAWVDSGCPAMDRWKYKPG
jgi:excisionase family DNA binding protein